MIPLKVVLNCLIKTVDGIITPIILLITRLIFVDSPADVVFARIRGLLLVPFIKCSSIPYIGTNVYFLELLTRKYVFGKKVRVLSSCKFHGPVKVGDNVFFNYNVEVRSHTIIGNNVSIGPNTLIISDTHELGNGKKRAGKVIFNKIIIEDGCWIGANVTILSGVTVGSGSVIAAGSTVTKNVRPNTLVAGIPAKEIRELKE